MTIELEEGDRQAILLALAKLSLSRPGWHPACLSRIADQLRGREMYEQFRSHGPDTVGNVLLSAAERMDWQQVVLNGGPPCFHVCEDGHFCGRAERWEGHDELHEFSSLADLLRLFAPVKET